MKFSFLWLFINGGFFLTAIAQTDSVQKEIILEDVIVTAQYAPTHYKNAVHEVRVIKAKEIQQQGQNNLAEVLSNQLNLRVATDPILGNGLKIQGIGGENIQIMMDGVPIIGRVDGDIDLSQINLRNIDRIEIIEGAMSAQYGSNASGGVVNIITKKAQRNQVQVESQNQYESIGIWNNSLTVGLQAEKIYASLTASRYHSSFVNEDSLRLYKTVELPDGDTYRTKVNPWNPKIQYGLDGTFRYRFSDSTNVTYQYRHFDETLSSLGEVRRPQFRPYAQDEFYRTLRDDHSLNLETYIGPHFYVKSTTGFNQYSRTKKTERIDFEPDTTSLVPGGTDAANFALFLHRSSISTLSMGKLNGQLGIEISHETGSGGRIIDSTSAPFNEAQITNYAAWASLSYQAWPTLTLQTNLRYGYNTKYDHPLIPSFHANWKPNKSWNFKMNYAQGFRSPSLKELHFNFIDINHYIVGNPHLEAEHSQNASLSVGYNTIINQKHDFSISTKFFYNSISNRILLVEYAPLQFNYQNISQFETHGMNFRVQYQFNKNLTFKSGLAYTRLFNIYSLEGDSDKFISLPEMQNELRYELPFIQTNLFITHRYIGKQVRFYTNDDGDIEQGYIGDYHIINATMSRDFWAKRVFAAVGVKNLLNTQTVSLIGQSDGTHSSEGNNQLLNWGRTYFIRLNITL